MRRFPIAAVFMQILCTGLVGCGPDTKLPPLPTPGPDACLWYESFNYSAEAAKAENIETLRKHNSNELRFSLDCVTNSPKLDPARPGGPR